MNYSERRKFRPECRFETLESREMLNGHMPSHVAHVAQVGARVPRVITGTLSGSNPYYYNQLNPNTGGDSYSVSGSTSAGQGAIAGTDLFAYTNINSNLSRDVYYSGDWTMAMSNGSTLKIAYTGVGKSTNTTYSETFKGSAVGTAGALWGVRFSFMAVGSGVGSTSPGAITFKIRLAR